LCRRSVYQHIHLPNRPHDLKCTFIPPPLQPSSSTNCSAYHLAVSGDYWFFIEEAALQQLRSEVPSLPFNETCKVLKFNEWNPRGGLYMCISRPRRLSSFGRTYTQPLTAGKISICTAFHLVISGDLCSLI
jgi:hypothetical protein